MTDLTSPTGSFDGAEVYELVGLYLLHHLSGILGKEAVGLYRDDGFAILRNTPGPNAERLKKQIIQIAEDLQQEHDQTKL